MEEEFLLVDPRTRTLAPDAEVVIATARAELGPRIGPELTAYQIETRTDPHTDLTALAEQLRTTRLVAARAAADHGVRLVASGAPVLAPPGAPPLTAGERYARSSAAHGALDDEEVACACHVHIGLGDRGQALAVSNHLRTWLPALTALTANSPFWAGRDTGHASWRSVTRHRWPVSGPPPLFASLSHYEDLVAALLATQTCPDTGGIYWDIRPSHTHPTLEIRIADTQPTVDDTVLLTALIRAAAATALREARSGRPAPQPDPQLLRAACWRAARDGLTGTALNLTHHRLEPARAQLRALRDWVAPALAAHPSDARTVDAQLRRIERTGTGAQRQRAAHARRHTYEDVVDTLITQTVAPPGSGTQAGSTGP
ncbi:glutamate--cysteine ligase [Streptomyces sp. NPDC006660]|uniref:carboxylate-amine ligase n=1 Tax=Streptomyces sp. NPDC006660 TaxID=3156901 RepID=UPI0033EA79B4